MRLRFKESLRNCDFQPLEGALFIKIFAGYPILKSTSKKHKTAMLAGIEHSIKKPDWNNVGKIVCDALNGISYKDDSQIVESQMQKRYIAGPGIVEVWISSL